MAFRVRSILISLLAGASVQAAPALAADSDDDALSLSSAPVEKTPQAPRNTRFFVEGALGVADLRDGSGTRSLRRLSFDFVHASNFAPGWRAVLSDRLDHMRPAEGAPDTINSLREAYVSWQQQSARSAVDVGRINLRYGPGYGYNPTDFFRDGALRTITSINPFALRENRLGTVVVRGQGLWSTGSVSLAWSPKLRDHASTNGADIDLGATNNRDRGLFVFSSQLSDRISGQVLLYKDRGLPVQFGASLTALVTEAIVAYAEGSRGREPDLLSRTLAIGPFEKTRNRFVTGLTYTTASKLSITGEYEYNGFALSPAQFEALGGIDPALPAAYVLQAVRRQDLASRQAWLLYATQKNIGLLGLELTALLRYNAGDHSRLAWLELRRHWDRYDVALRLQQQGGRDTTEYGLIPQRRSAQVVGNVYF